MTLARASVILLVALSACASGAYWETKQVSPTFRSPPAVNVYVVVSNQIAENDSNGGVLTVVETLESDLKSEGRAVRVIPARRDEPAPLPRFELQFEEFIGGDRAMRGATANPMLLPVLLPNPIAMAGSRAAVGRIVIDCYLLPGPDLTPSLMGRVRGFVASGADNDSAEAAGHLLAKTLLAQHP